MTAATGLEDLHELVSFDDPHEDRTWVFDVTFLESNWTCIFGSGCKGVYDVDTTEKMEGCCTHGAHLVDKADRENLRMHADRLRTDQWQFMSIGEKKGYTKKNEDGAHVTRVVDGACIFLNRPGHPNGAGCALHSAALEAGERPLDWKPEVCWQLPLRRVDETDSNWHVTSTVREWKRRDWGPAGNDFHWWCTDAPDAFVDKRSVWQTMAAELTEMVGTDVFDLLAGYMATRKGRNRPASGAKAVVISSKPDK